MGKCIMVGCDLHERTMLLMAAVPALAEDTPSGGGINWQQWESLPVLDGGRQKPLDTLAWETLRTIGNRSSFEHPETGEKLSPTSLYLTMFFQWKGQ